jgi:hypothetical protein
VSIPFTFQYAFTGPVSYTSPQVSADNSGGIGVKDATLDTAEAGSLTTRTDNDTGTITMSSGGHTITTGEVVDVYWSGGVRYGMTVGTVSGTSVPIDAGAGDNLPSAATAVTVVVQKSINVTIDGDNVTGLFIVLSTANVSLREAGHIQFRDVSNAAIVAYELITNVPRFIYVPYETSNPLTGNVITNAKVSYGGTTASQTPTIIIAGTQDASP